VSIPAFLSGRILIAYPNNDVMNNLFMRCLFIALVTPFCSNAQQVVNVSGGSATSGYYRFDWSVGELCLVDSYNQVNFILENGFLHPGTERPGNNSNNFFARGDIMVFPNPAYVNTEINITVQQPGIVNMQLVDVLGRIMLSKQFNYNGVGHIEKLDVQRYRAGTYFVHVVLTPTDASQPQRKGVYKLTHLLH
jgi:hypothetical protein